MVPSPFERRTPRAPSPARLRLAVLVAALFAVGCGSSTPDDVIDRETFIDAYVDLRVAALDTDSQRVAAADRDAILQRLGVTEDDLLRFADVHGEDLDFMRDVWNDVELRLDRPSDPAPAADGDSISGGEPDADERTGSGDRGGAGP